MCATPPEGSTFSFAVASPVAEIDEMAQPHLCAAVAGNTDTEAPVHPLDVLGSAPHGHGHPPPGTPLETHCLTRAASSQRAMVSRLARGHSGWTGSDRR
jgi:hypothetical protein